MNKWYLLTLDEINNISDEMVRKEYLSNYNTMWKKVVIPLSELLNCNLDIIGEITIKNVVNQYREALNLIGISKEKQDEFIRKRLKECK